MRHPLKTYFFFSILLVLIPAVSRADSFSAFLINPASINSGGITAVSWTLDSTGHSISVACPQGVKIKKTDGSSFPCNQKTTVNTGASGSVGLIITNVSGSTQNIPIRVNAKNADGTDNDAVTADGIVSVATSPQPITSFTTSSTTASSGLTLTYTWTSQDLDGVNFMFECKDEITASSMAYAAGFTIPCGAPVFSRDLPPSGTQTFSFANHNSNPTLLKITLLPAAGGGTYDATHAPAIYQEIMPYTAKIPTVTSFMPSKPVVYSGEPFTLSWKADYAQGVNFKFNCDSAYISAAYTDSSGALSKLPCFAYAFASAMDPSGSMTVIATNTSSIDIDLPILAIPQLSDGSYDSLKSGFTRITVLRPSAQGVTAMQIEQKTVQAPLDAISSKFAAGSRIRPTSNLKVRATASPTGVLMATQSPQQGGVVIGGPKAAGGYVWWQIQWDTAVTGWSAEDFLETASLPPTVQQSVASGLKNINRFVFTTLLKRGSAGATVCALLGILKGDAAVYPEGLVSGYYGPATERAVGRFQERYGIAKKGDVGYGTVGPKTRAQLNAL